MNSRPCPLCHHPHATLFQKVDDLFVVSCRACDFTFLGNPPAAKAEKEHYEHYFASTKLGDYEQDSLDPEIRSIWAVNEQRLAWLQRYVAGGRLLDVGCGRGFFLEHACRQGFISEGLEISTAAAHYVSERLGITVHLCNLDQESTLEGSYDVICLWHVLEHFRQPVEVLERVWNLCAPGGRIFIEVPNLNSLKFQLSLPSRRWRGGNHPRYHRSFFTRASLARTLTVAGFQQLEYGTPSYGTAGLKRAVKSRLNRFGLDSFIDVTAVAARR